MASEGTPLKYPTIFNTADVAIITKMDMTEAADCDLVTASGERSAGSTWYADVRDFLEKRRGDA